MIAVSYERLAVSFFSFIVGVWPTVVGELMLTPLYTLMDTVQACINAREWLHFHGGCRPFFDHGYDEA